MTGRYLRDSYPNPFGVEPSRKEEARMQKAQRDYDIVVSAENRAKAAKEKKSKTSK